jgi:phthalate 4,5-dioxygenase
MPTRAENEALTSVGPGTLMGNFMRQYWLPALKSGELPRNDCAPVRVMLLGEKLIAFRDSNGQVGLLQEACPHRGVSLFLGRNAAAGLRCAYHGWKFNVRGECVEIPCEPVGSTLYQKIRLRACRCRERGGIVWAYMGPRETPPPLPHLEMNMEGQEPRRVDLTLVECNWLQNLEGDVDVDHIAILHGGNLGAFKAVLRGEDRVDGGRGLHSPSLERLFVESMDSAVGCTYACDVTGASRKRGGSVTLPQVWSVGQFMLPFYAMLPYGALGAHWVVARVPMDDHHTMTFGMHAANGPMPPQELMFGPAPAYLPNSDDWFGRFRLTRNVANGFALDRSLTAQFPGAFGAGAGIQGQAVQDAAVVQSMGAVADRTQEHLGVGDAMVVRLRRRLLSAARAVELGVTPPGVDYPDGYRVKQGLLRTRSGRTWQEELEHLCERSMAK